jgi:hypothetical protein
MTTVTINGNDYSDDANPLTGLGNGGHRTRLLPMLGDMLAVAGALVAGPSTAASSTASLTVGGGTKNLTVEAGKNLAAGMSVKIASAANPTAWMHGDVLSYDSGSGALAVNVTHTQGAGTYASWIVSLSAPYVGRSLPYVALSAGATLTAPDLGKFIEVTANTFTLAFDAAASLGSGWYAFLRNAGSGDITLDPSGAERIDGRSSYIMYPGETRLIQSDGSALRSAVLHPFCKDFGTPGAISFTTPPGYRMLEGLVIGAGGSGRKSAAGLAASGGSGGGCVPIRFKPVAGNVLTGTVGAGGAGVTAASTNGNAGADSTFAGVTGYGGGGGSVSGANGGGTFTPFAGGGVGGGAGYGGGGSSAGAVAGNSLYGGGAGGGVNAAGTLYAAGSSAFGGAGGAAGSSASGADGGSPGGGGGGTQTGAYSGAGGAGRVTVWGVA